MKTVVIIFIISLAFTPLVEGAFLGLDLELHSMEDQAITAKIRAFDKEFFKDFDVYMSEDKEAPTALLFDRKDQYSIPGRFWGEPLSEEEIVYAIKRLDDQYNEGVFEIPRLPTALNIVNTKGEVLGYVYTGIDTVLMDRKDDGRVIVYQLRAETHDSVGGGAGAAAGGGGGAAGAGPAVGAP
ncbi:MAG: hypothetical protein JXA50_04275 [Deltaproteobacteria bacterium]|nr:hypothetical protein [Deltaproteobacteria bacterium]